MPELADHRTLGVAIGALFVNGVAADLDGAVFGKGFHATERQQGLAWRWTDGSADLVLDAAEAEAVIEIEVAMVAPSWKRALPAHTLIAA